MQLVYVAGPVRNASHWERHQNILRGEEVALRLWQLGFAVISPHKNCEFMDGALTDKQIIKGDLEIISRCDALVLIKGWEHSEGAQQERDYCLANDIRVFYWENADSYNELLAWYDPIEGEHPCPSTP